MVPLDPRSQPKKITTETKKMEQNNQFKVLSKYLIPELNLPCMFMFHPEFGFSTTVKSKEDLTWSFYMRSTWPDYCQTEFDRVMDCLWLS